MKTVALLILLQIVAEKENSPISHYIRARLYEREGKVDLAISEYEKALNNDSKSLVIRERLADLYLTKQNPKKALSFLIHIAKERKDAGLWQRVGEIFLKEGSYKKAAIAFEKSLESKESLGALYGLAETYVVLGKSNLAISTYKKILKLFPQERRAMLSLAYLYDSLGKRSEAISEYRKVLTFYPNNTAIIRRLLVLLVEERRREAKLLTRHLANIAKSPADYLLLGYLAEEREETERFYKMALAKNPRIKEPYIRLGYLLLREERIDEGLSLIKKALSFFPKDSAFLRLKGLFLIEKKELEEAISIYKCETKRSPEDDTLWYQLGVAYDEAGKRREAFRCFYKAINLNPENAPSYNHIGYTWADENKNLKRALKYIEKALAIDPENPAYIDSLGWCYYRMGRLEDALEQLLRAFEIEEDPIIAEHIGDVYKDMENMDEAERFYRKAVELGGKIEKERWRGLK